MQQVQMRLSGDHEHVWTHAVRNIEMDKLPRSEGMII